MQVDPKEKKLPTPRQAAQQARDTGLVVLANDLRLYDGRPFEQYEADVKMTGIIFQCFEALEALATMPVSAPELVEMMPDYTAYQVDRDLEAAMNFISHLNTIWRERNVQEAK